MLKRVRIIADYQFGAGAGNMLFPETVTFTLSRTGRVSQVLDAGKRVATLRSYDGLFTLSELGARRLHAHTSSPRLRVVMNRDAAPFVEAGKTAFARHVMAVDPELRANDEVLLVDENDVLLATGSALLSPAEMLAFTRGTAVRVRHGFTKKC
ncbi:MAG: PUA domain-containing protein [Halobacteriota archaeon]